MGWCDDVGWSLATTLMLAQPCYRDFVIYLGKSFVIFRLVITWVIPIVFWGQLCHKDLEFFRHFLGETSSKRFLIYFLLYLLVTTCNVNIGDGLRPVWRQAGVSHDGSQLRWLVLGPRFFLLRNYCRGWDLYIGIFGRIYKFFFWWILMVFTEFIFFQYS